MSKNYSANLEEELSDRSFKYVKQKQNRFKYFFKNLVYQRYQLSAKKTTTTEQLKMLAQHIFANQPSPKQAHSGIPVGYTYLGQFINHDMNEGIELFAPFKIVEKPFEPISPDELEDKARNKKSPFFDLFNVYGEEANKHKRENPALYEERGIRFKIGTNAANADPKNAVPSPQLGLKRDLPRNEVSDETLAPYHPIMADIRNENNLIIAQLHVAILKFHNEAVDYAEKTMPGKSDLQIFKYAHRETRFHYQWLVVHDYLKRIIAPAIYKELLTELYDGNNQNTIFKQANETIPFTPVEFTAAVFRFGHSMIRQEYDFNENFGREKEQLASLNSLFDFTSQGANRIEKRQKTDKTLAPQLPADWIIDWKRFFDIDTKNPDLAHRFARAINTNMALPLKKMPNKDHDLLSEKLTKKVKASTNTFNGIMRNLATLDLLRGHLFSLPSGQETAQAWQQMEMGKIRPLTSKALKSNNSDALNKLLKESGFLEHTPLWYYILKEAEVQGNGKHLGDLGSYMMGKTMIGLLKKDVASYINDEAEWTIEKGIIAKVTGKPFEGISDFLRFAKVME